MLEAELKVLMLPRDPNDDKNVIIEIRGAEGGEEANLFARDLYEMYESFAGRMGWSSEMIDGQRSDLGGFTTVTFALKGDGVWTRMKHEGGPHRVQRVPVTESQGRVHTSSATVTVLPEAEEVDIEIFPNATCRSTSTDRRGRAVSRSTPPTPRCASPTSPPASSSRSRREVAAAEQGEGDARAAVAAPADRTGQAVVRAQRSAPRQVGGGGRSEKIRTYNFKENRVTDHRIDLTIYKLDRVLAGELDDVVDALVADERRRQLEEE